MRKKLIFLHIPKNGGTTLTSILTRYFNADKIFNVKVLDSKRMNTDEFLNMDNEKRKEINLLTGHMNFGYHKYLNGETDYITFLRDPVERAISFFYYSKNDPKNRLYEVINGNNWTLNEFLKNANEEDITNAQVRLLSGIKGDSVLMLKKAIENVDKHFSLVGFQDQFDESIILLSSLYNWSCPFYKKRKVTLNRPLINELDTQTIDLIISLNKEDIILYNYCKEKFNFQLNSIKNLNFKLMRLRVFNRLYGSTKYKNLKKMFSKFRFK